MKYPNLQYLLNDHLIIIQFYVTILFKKEKKIERKRKKSLDLFQFIVTKNNQNEQMSAFF